MRYSEYHRFATEPPAAVSEQCIVIIAHLVQDAVHLRNCHVDEDVQKENPAPDELVPASCGTRQESVNSIAFSMDYDDVKVQKSTTEYVVYYIAITHSNRHLLLSN